MIGRRGHTVVVAAFAVIATQMPAAAQPTPSESSADDVAWAVMTAQLGLSRPLALSVHYAARAYDGESAPTQLIEAPTPDVLSFDESDFAAISDIPMGTEVWVSGLRLGYTPDVFERATAIDGVVQLRYPDGTRERLSFEPRDLLPPSTAAAELGDIAVSGSPDPERIAGVINARTNHFTSCYRELLPANPELGGEMVIEFRIGMFGRVQELSVTRSLAESGELEPCVIGRLRRLRFQQHDPPASVTVPLVFTPSRTE